MSEDVVGVEQNFEARIVSGGMPTDCCDYGVISHSKGKEVCRVWEEADARLIADLLNATLTPEPSAAVDLEGVKKQARELLAAEVGPRHGLDDRITPTRAALRAIETAIAAHTNRGEVERLRDSALEEAALIADKWRDDNRAGVTKARKRAGLTGDDGLADMLDGAAIECNAIGQAIRALKSSTALSSPDTVKDVSATAPAAGEASNG